MTTITKERVAEIIHAAGLEPCDYEEVFGSIKTGEIVAMARIALASLEAEPALYAAEETLAYAKHGELHLTCLSEPMGDAVIPLYATHPAQRTPDMTDFRPCPFCNSPVKWCGENSADPEDDHACHHIQCTNHECGADFDFTNTGDDLLPDDPETLDAMTAAECLQPLRNVCLNRFNSRAAMLQGAEQLQSAQQNIPEIIPGGLVEAVNNLLNNDGSRGRYSAIGCGEARERIELWLAQRHKWESQRSENLCAGNSPVIPDDVLSAVRKVARIRADFDHFDGDRRGIADCLDEAEQELIVTINEHAAMLQTGNDSTTGKPLTITLPDITSKAFWSGTGKSETFHPETYKRWVKEAIERACVITGIRVVVK